MRGYLMLSLIVSAVVMPFLVSGVLTATQPASCAPGSDGKCPTGCTCLDNPLQPYGANKEQPDIPIIIGYAIKTVLGVVGGLALLMFVWGGFNWLTSAGNSEKVKKGTEAMVWAGIGLVVTLSSYIIVKEIFAKFIS